ncbi:hypothetical protein [Oceanobacillus piezotolerans]|uniref:hypothetical protein n=1 Tax=Oceanobacillus piezotolerans TaxID=2448030 RepID=UPI001656FF05|nr:hypothetical protein [Oceanobacillus piezotolerans]
MKYTSEMEKAMEQSHGMNYAEYERKLSNRLKVEKSREASYQKSKQILSEVNAQVHK